MTSVSMQELFGSVSNISLSSNYIHLGIQLICTFKNFNIKLNPWSYWTRICPAFANSVDPDQLASED